MKRRKWRWWDTLAWKLGYVSFQYLRDEVDDAVHEALAEAVTYHTQVVEHDQQTTETNENLNAENQRLFIQVQELLAANRRLTEPVDASRL